MTHIKHIPQIILLVISFATVLQADLSYDGKTITFENTSSLTIQTCIKNICQYGFASGNIDDANITIEAQPIINRLFITRIWYSFPSSEKCILKITSDKNFTQIRKDTEDSLLFSDGKQNFVISKGVNSPDEFTVIFKPEEICILPKNTHGEIKFELDSTGKNNPEAYYQARLHMTYTIGPEIALIDSNNTNIVIQRISGVDPIQISSLEITPKISFSNCTNLTFYYSNIVGGNKSQTGCIFEDLVQTEQKNAFFAPFDTITAEITTNATIQNFSSPISTSPSEFEAKISTSDKKIVITITRANSEQTMFVGIVLIITIALLYALCQKGKLDGITMITMPFAVLACSKYIFTIFTLGVVVLYIFVISNKIWPKHRT